jgi:membrane fusion protein (multidrug efflux system)
MAVEVAKVAASDFSDEASAVGSLKSNESVVLRPETAGRIAAIGFKDGAIVGKGTVLVALDAAVQEAELQQAKANLALAQNQQRNQELLAKKFVSQQALDNSGPR